MGGGVSVPDWPRFDRLNPKCVGSFMNLLFSSTTSTMNLLWLWHEFGVVLLIADRGTAYVWVETTSNSFSGLLGLGGSKCFGGGRGCLLRIGRRHMCRLKPPQDTVSCSFEWLWSLGENALKGWGHLLWIGGRHMCRLKPPWWDHFFTSEPEKYKTKTPTSFEGWGFYIDSLQLSYCFSSSWLLSPRHFLTSTSKLPHFLTSFLLGFGFLDWIFLDCWG